MLFQKKIVLIGGTGGIGLSAARAFVQRGAQVVAVGYDEASCREAEQVLGNQAVVSQGDATLESTATQAIETCLQRWGGFDGLYHVAGGSGRAFGDGALHELTLEGWDKTLRLNLTSVMLSNRAAVSVFLELKKGGAILNLSSVLAWSPSPQHFASHAYAATKAAIIGFSQSIAAYYAPHDIRVNVLAPALVESPMSQRALGNEKIMAYIAQKQPLDGGRAGQPQDLDGMAALLLSDEGRFITGQVIAVDGGWSIS